MKKVLSGVLFLAVLFAALSWIPDGCNGLSAYAEAGEPQFAVINIPEDPLEFAENEFHFAGTLEPIPTYPLFRADVYWMYTRERGLIQTNPETEPVDGMTVRIHYKVRIASDGMREFFLPQIKVLYVFAANPETHHGKWVASEPYIPPTYADIANMIFAEYILPHLAWHTLNWTELERDGVKMHFKQCNLCGENAGDPAVHTFTKWRMMDLGEHTRSCSACGVAEYAPHSYLEGDWGFGKDARDICEEGGIWEGFCECGFIDQIPVEPGHQFQKGPCDGACDRPGCGVTREAPHVYRWISSTIWPAREYFHEADRCHQALRQCAICKITNYVESGHEYESDDDDTCVFCGDSRSIANGV